MTPKQGALESRADLSRRGGDIAAIVGLYHSLVGRQATTGPAFLDVSLTMAQAKVLFLVEAVGELHMSELVARLGVSLSTVSGLVERLVDQGLVSRHHDPADRRQVVVTATAPGAALVDRFRQFGVGELQALLNALSDEELGDVRRAFEALDRAIARAAASR